MSPFARRQTRPDWAPEYQVGRHTRLRLFEGALGLDGRPALTKRDLRVRFPAGAPHPGAGSLWLVTTIERPGTVGSHEFDPFSRRRCLAPGAVR